MPRRSRGPVRRQGARVCALSCARASSAGRKFGDLCRPALSAGATCLLERSCCCAEPVLSATQETFVIGIVVHATPVHARTPGSGHAGAHDRRGRGGSFAVAHGGPAPLLTLSHAAIRQCLSGSPCSAPKRTIGACRSGPISSESTQGMIGAVARAGTRAMLRGSR